MAAANPIEAARCGAWAWVRVQGPATFKLAPALLGLVDALFEEAVEEIHIDLSGCKWLDSTFSGSLVSIIRRCQPRGRLRLVLNRPSDHCLESLRRMHLDQLFHMDSAPPPDLANWQALAADGIPKEALSNVVIRAHEELAAVNPANEQFKRVAQTFAEQPEQ